LAGETPAFPGFRLFSKFTMNSLILFNANAFTLDPRLPKAELIAIDDGRITHVSGNHMLAGLKQPGTQLIDCRGRTLLPGFVDAHCHVWAYAESLVSVNLSPRAGVRSIADIQRNIADACGHQLPGTWVKGKGYSEFILEEKRHPTRHDLDVVSPLHPVKLTHRSGHAHVLNSLALRQLGITTEIGDPPEGLMDRDPQTGELNGILYGMSAFLAERMTPTDDALMKRGLAMANEKLLSYGITSIQDASSGNRLKQGMRLVSMKAVGLLQPRLNLMLGWKGFMEQRACPDVLLPDRAGMRLGGIKLIVDEVTGSLHPEQEVLNAQVLAIHRAGFQAIIHAIEPNVIEAAAEAIAYAVKRYPRIDPRHRIEHCSVCPPSLRRKLSNLGITVVTQPSFIYYSGDRYLETVADDQRKALYPVGSLRRSGLPIGFGSDFPISDPNPLVGICAAVTRMTESGRTLLPRQKIAVSDAIGMYTLGSAAAAFEEESKGSIRPGKVADLVMLSEDPYKIEAAHIKDIQVLMTILDGKVVWEKTPA
jgi:predicted amidohydrolase YtcJ